MKKTLLALAIGAVATVPAAALADAQLYGKLNLSLDHFDGADGTGNGGQHTLNSNESYFGLRGDAALDGSLKAIYQLEFGVNLNTTGTLDTAPGAPIGLTQEDHDVFFGRNVFLGVEGNFGTVKAGRFDSPIRAMATRVDQFNEMFYTDIGNLVEGELRPDNIIQYSTPKLADLVTIDVATQANGDVPAASKSDQKLFKAFSFAANFDLGEGIYAGLGYDKNGFHDSIVNPGEADIIRVIAGMNMDALDLGLLVQQTDYEGQSRKDLSIVVSGAFAVSDVLKVKAQIGQTDIDVTGRKEFKQYTLGADYKLGAQTTTYAYATRQEERDREFAAVGVGLEHRF